MSRVIIDTDCGIDDALALIYAIESNLDIIGITSCNGNVNSQESAKNIFAVLDLVNRNDIPVLVSDTTNLDGEFIDAKDTHGEDGLGETYYGSKYSIDHLGNAEKFIIESLKKYDDVTILALGPLTNLARAYNLNEEVFNNCKEIITMGGVFRSQGNMTPVTEYNYYHDPKAVDIIMNSSIKKTIIPLDVTREIFLTPDVIEGFSKESENLKFIEDVTKFYIKFHLEAENFNGCIINDILVIAYFKDRSICSGINAPLEVVKEGYLRGMLLVDELTMFYKDNQKIDIMTSVDSKNVLDDFIKTVT
ncbi:nucleoside hydrolase [Mycoplasmatota bacterium WC44]